jgi:hypothetical protein
MVAVPGPTPVTTPLEDPTLAIPPAPELQVPPKVVEDSVVVPVTQTVGVPVIGAGGVHATDMITRPLPVLPILFTGEVPEL